MQETPGVEANEGRLLAAFRRAARDMPWYRTLLDEASVHSSEIVDAVSFARRVPILTKQNTFDRFPIDQLAATARISQLAGVLTSSGHGGRFAFGLTTRRDAALGPELIDLALEAAFAVESRPTLVVNCLPMGVGFGSARATVATTSVREDMALALVDTFGRHYEQVVLVADPLFAKRLTDYAARQAFDWSRHRTHVVLGEEIFGEHFRAYLAACLGLDVDHAERGYIMSSFGVGELGLHLAYETPATIALRRAAWIDDDLAADLLGCVPGSVLVPLLLAYDARRTFVEVVDPDDQGYGQLAISLLDPELPIPLLRYATGDLARVLDAAAISAACDRHGLAAHGGLPPRLIALRGRLRDRLPNGVDLGLYKDALYADRSIARQVSGAFRIVAADHALTLHVQRAVSAASDPSEDGDLRLRILRSLPVQAAPADVIVWPYERFPYGMSIDYERKFQYF